MILLSPLVPTTTTYFFTMFHFIPRELVIWITLLLVWLDRCWREGEEEGR